MKWKTGWALVIEHFVVQAKTSPEEAWGQTGAIALVWGKRRRSGRWEDMGIFWENDREEGGKCGDI